MSMDVEQNTKGVGQHGWTDVPSVQKKIRQPGHALERATVVTNTLDL